jgi:aspartate/methionine/tyrosine aminotransferase
MLKPVLKNQTLKSQTTQISERMQYIAPFHVMDLLAKAKAMEANGQSILHMEVGEPDFPTPKPILNAGINALQAANTRYTAAQGLTALQEKISAFYQQRYEVDVNPARILVTPGASGALQLLLACLLNPQDELLVTDPGYPCNRHFVHLYGGKPVSIPVTAATAYQPTPVMLEQYSNPQTRGLLIASPSNPTGTTLSAEQLDALFEFTKNKQQALIVDEIYHGLTYDEPVSTALQLPHDPANDELFVVNSFSKYFGMTGWRLGWLVVPDAYIEPATRLAQNLFLSAPTPAQYAALHAFDDETVRIMDAQRDTLRERRDYFYDALIDLGFELGDKPNGGFYLYANISRFSNDSYAFCTDLLEKTGVAITPGIDFGDYRANEHVRFAYTVSIDRLKEAVVRLAEYLKR